MILALLITGVALVWTFTVIIRSIFDGTCFLIRL